MSNYNSTLQSNNTDLQAILNTINELPEVATPSITVNASGLITATAGTKTSTHQLAFQAAKTITPTTASQIAVSSGYYTGGNITVAAVPTQTKNVTPKATSQNVTPDSGKFLSKVTVAGDSNLVAGNIKNGISIFGVNGTYTGNGSSGSSEYEEADSLITMDISSYTNSRVSNIGQGAFAYASKLQSVNFNNCTTISASAFAYCSRLTTVSFPTCTTISDYAFWSCYNLTSLYLTGSSLCNLSNSNAFTSTPIGGYSASAGTYGSIYVPASLLTSYQTATNWAYFSSRFVAYGLEEPDDPEGPDPFG